MRMTIRTGLYTCVVCGRISHNRVACGTTCINEGVAKGIITVRPRGRIDLRPRG